MRTAGTGTIAARGRIPGYDLARGLAVLVMVVLNFRGVLSGSQVYPHWLDLTLAFLDRRAAVALVMISGAGISLYARCTWDRSRQTELLRRGIFLLMTGMVLSMIWSGDILHVYGVLICMGSCLVRRPCRALLCFGLFFGAGAAVRWCPLFDLIEEGGVNWIWDGAADLFFTGYFPLFPWAAVFTAGMGLGRLDIRNIRVRQRLWGLGIGLFILAEWGSSVFAQADWARMDLSLPTLPAMVSGIGSGLCLILAGLWVADRPGAGRLRYVAAVGRTSLSFYILHILVLVALAPWTGRGGIPDLTLVSVGAVSFFFLYAGTAARWLKFRRGPFEQAMREFPFIRRPSGKPGLSSPVRP